MGCSAITDILLVVVPSPGLIPLRPTGPADCVGAAAGDSGIEDPLKAPSARWEAPVGLGNWIPPSHLRRGRWDSP